MEKHAFIHNFRALFQVFGCVLMFLLTHKSSRTFTNLSEHAVAEGYVAKDMRCPVLEEDYYFGLANERSETTRKLRVIIAKAELLEHYVAHSTAAEIAGEMRWEQGDKVECAQGYFKRRWEHTLKNMADLYKEGSKTLRKIELSVAASRVDLETVDTKLDAVVGEIHGVVSRTGE